MNISFLFILLGCQSSWDIVDVDGDGTTILDGDCWEQGDPPQIEGALEHTLTANDIGVGKYDAPYDGIDANAMARTISMLMVMVMFQTSFRESQH